MTIQSRTARQQQAVGVHSGLGSFVQPGPLGAYLSTHGLSSVGATGGGSTGGAAEPRVNVLEPHSRASNELRRFGGSKSQGLYPTTTDPSIVRQQELTNCPLLAVLAALVHTCPAQIKQVIRQRPGRPISTLIDKNGNRIGSPKVQPEGLFQVSFSDGDTINVSDLLFFRFGRLVYGFSTDRTAWVPLIEKAYVFRKATNFIYENLNGQVSPEFAMVDILGPCLKLDLDAGQSEQIAFDDGGDLAKGATGTVTDDSLLKVLEAATKRATIATTISAPQRAIGGHTYTVLRVTGNTGKQIHLREAMRDSSLALTLPEFRRDFDSVIQAIAHAPC